MTDRLGRRYVARQVVERTVAAARTVRPRRRTLVPTTGSRELAGSGRAVRTVLRQEVATSLRRPEGISWADWRAYRIRDVTSLPEEFVLELDRAVVLGRAGWVVSDGRLVDDIWSEAGFPSERMAARAVARHLSRGVGDERARHLGGTTVSLLIPWMPNYYHWTVQAVPRAAMVASVVPPGSVDHWLVPDPAPAYVADWLDRLGVPPADRVPVANGDEVTCDHLVVASIPARNRYIPPWVVEHLRGCFDAPDERGRRLYIDRPPTDKRRITNRGEVLSLVRDHGFEVVQLDGTTVAEQAALFSSADAVVGVHGAGFTNLVYCRPGTRVVELLPNNLFFPTHPKLCEAAGLEYACVRGVEPALPWPWRFPDVTADTEVDLTALAEELRGTVSA